MNNLPLAKRISRGRAWLICHMVSNCHLYGYKPDYAQWRRNLALYERLVTKYKARGGVEQDAWDIPDTVENMSEEQTKLKLIGPPPTEMTVDKPSLWA